MLCQSENNIDYNCFISFSTKDGNQLEVYHRICDDIRKDITILDVDIKHTGVDENLRNSVLSKITECQLFICILTPFCVDGKYAINNNVILELGYALSCVKEENIHCFVINDNEFQDEYIKCRPSLLDDIKYETYSSSEDIINFIEYKFESDKNCDYHSYDGLKNHILKDETCVSMIKFEYLIKLENSNSCDIYEIMSEYLCKYNCYETIDMSIMHIIENIGTLNTVMNECFFYVLHYHILGSEWLSKKNNQIRIDNILKHLIYILFHKYSRLNESDVISNRMNLALLLIESLNTRHIPIPFKKWIRRKIDESIAECEINCNNKDYIVYIELLKCEHKSSKGNERDLILNDFYQKNILECKTGYNRLYYRQNDRIEACSTSYTGKVINIIVGFQIFFKKNLAYFELISQRFYKTFSFCNKKKPQNKNTVIVMPAFDGIQKPKKK